MIFVNSEISTFFLKCLLLWFSNRLSDTYPLLLDILARDVVNEKFLLQILLYRLFRIFPILLELLPILLLHLLQISLMLHLNFKLALFFVLHVNHKLLLLTCITDPLVHLFLINCKLVKTCFHAHHLELFLFPLKLSLHHGEVGVTLWSQTSHIVECCAHVQSVRHLRSLSLASVWQRHWSKLHRPVDRVSWVITERTIDRLWLLFIYPYLFFCSLAGSYSCGPSLIMNGNLLQI